MAAVVDRTGGPHHLLDFIIPCGSAEADCLLCRITGRGTGENAPLHLVRQAGRSRGIALAPDGAAIRLAGGRIYLVTLLVQGTPKGPTGNFADPFLAVIPALNGVADRERLARGTSAGDVDLSVSAAFLLPVTGQEQALSFLTETSEGELSGPAGTVSVIAVAGL